MKTNQEYMKELNDIALSKSTPFCYQCYEKCPSGRCPKCHSDDLMRHGDGIGVEYGVDHIVEDFLENQIESINEADLEEQYEEFLDECYGEVKIAAYSYSTSHALKVLDPVAYREGYLEWLDSMMKDDQLITFDDCTYYTPESLDAFIKENS